MYPYIGDFTNLAGYPPLKQTISAFVFTSLTTTYHEYGSSIQGRSQDGAKVEDLKYLSRGKIFLVPTLSLSPICPRKSKCLSMEKEVGTMQFRVRVEQIKNDERKKREKKK
jgi:hypothetical protein